MHLSGVGWADYNPGMSAPSDQSVTTAIIDADLLCPACGYNLRGLSEHRCPECGEGFDPAVLSETALPWSHRRRLGRVRAYWGTVSMVMFRPRMLAAEMMHRQSYRDSQLFRWITVGLAVLPVLFATMVNWDGRAHLTWAPPDGGRLGLGSAAIHLFAAFLAFTVITGLPSYFFHPRRLSIENQDRAIALSYYACAPLAISPFLFPIGWTVHGIFERNSGWLAANVVLVFLCAFWWRALVVLTGRGLGLNRPGRTIAVALAIPVLWIVVGNLVETGVIQLLKFAAFVFFSLQD